MICFVSSIVKFRSCCKTLDIVGNQKVLNLLSINIGLWSDESKCLMILQIIALALNKLTLLSDSINRFVKLVPFLLFL